MAFKGQEAAQEERNELTERDIKRILFWAPVGALGMYVGYWVLFVTLTIFEGLIHG